MQLDHRPWKIVAQSGSRYLHSCISENKEMITVVGAVTAVGGCLPAQIIVKGMMKTSLPSHQTDNEKNCITISRTQEVVSDFF